MKHIFDIEVATKYGVNAAVILECLAHWIKVNEANERNFHDGDYWTFNTRKAYMEIFPYMSKKVTDATFQKLIDEGLIKTGVYNDKPFDRTLWYALTDKGKEVIGYNLSITPKGDNAISQKGTLEDTEREQPIPINNTINKINNSINKEKEYIRKRTPFVKPTLTEVLEYCAERGNNVDPEAFIDHYEANGWLVGKSPMKDWKAAVRTWERNHRNTSAGYSAPMNKTERMAKELHDFYRDTEEWVKKHEGEDEDDKIGIF